MLGGPIKLGPLPSDSSSTARIWNSPLKMSCRTLRSGSRGTKFVLGWEHRAAEEIVEPQRTFNANDLLRAPRPVLMAFCTGMPLALYFDVLLAHNNIANFD